MADLNLKVSAIDKLLDYAACGVGGNRRTDVGTVEGV